MLCAAISLPPVVLYFLVILFPLLALYIGYLIVTKAFQQMEFSSLEAIIIVFVSFLLGANIIDDVVGIPFANLPLFTYHEFWRVGINVGGAVIPLLLSLYLWIKNRLKILRVFLGIGLVAVVTYLVTYPDPEKGIVSRFPFWFLPVFIASVLSIVLYWKEKRKAAPLAYICGTLGVLIGADCFHLITLLNTEIHSMKNAVIGGANVFDLVYITGILAVFLDSILLYQEKRKKGKDTKGS
jgi:uncharacterized membrane protein